MKEAGQIETVVDTSIPLTTRERIERDRRVEEQQRREANARLDAESLAQRNAAVAEESFQKSLKSQADQEELDARNKLVSLQDALVDEKNKAAALRHEAEATPELSKLREEIAARENEIVWRPFAEARPGAIDELNRLRTLLVLWPVRKKYLQGQLPDVEKNIENLTAEIAKHRTLFAKLQEAAKKFWN